MTAPEVAPRRLPYPYEAMVALCSDLDATPDWRVYLDTMRYLNTSGATALGPGLGLEVGNSIYFDMAPREFAYWNTDDCGRHVVRALIRSGHVDCLHSFGTLAATRASAQRALDELARHDCRLEVWTDHSVAPTNFGGDIMRGRGDVPSSPAYHADLTRAYGIEFVWRGRVTSVIGQDVPRALGGIVDARHPLASARTVAKEAAKGVIARLGYARYAMHAANDVLRPAVLRDGQEVWEFLRCNPHWAGVGRGESAPGLADVLGERVLGRLLRSGGVGVIYTHLGKVASAEDPLGPPTRAALARLAELAREGRILVTTTRRLLGYCRAMRELRVAVSRENDRWTAALTVPVRAGVRPGGVSDLDGITVHVPDAERARLRVNGREVAGIRRNPPDRSGRPSVSLPWPPLSFPLSMGAP
jgi:hypothetical protein